MASFGVSMVDAGSVAAAAGAGLVNATAGAAAPAAAAGAVHFAAHVSQGVVTGVQIAGNIFSIIALLIPMRTYVQPVYQAKGVGARTIYNFVTVLFNALFWLLFAIPSKPRTVLTLTVNCVAIASQIVNIGVYLKYAVDENFTRSRNLVMLSTLFVVVVIVIAAPLMFMTDPWRVKVLGITASSLSTCITLVCGIIDVVTVAKAQRSGFNKYQLVFNLISASIWAAYGFLFDPINIYVVIPNLTGVGLTTIQIAFHCVLCWKDRRNNARNQPAA